MNKKEIRKEIINEGMYDINNSTFIYTDQEIDLIVEKLEAKINYTRCCKSVKNIDNKTPLEKIKVLTNTLETFRNIPYTTDAIITAIKKIDNLIAEL